MNSNSITRFPLNRKLLQTRVYNINGIAWTGEGKMATVGMVVKLGIHATYLLHLRNMHEFVGIIHGML